MSPSFTSITLLSLSFSLLANIGLSEEPSENTAQLAAHSEVFSQTLQLMPEADPQFVEQVWIVMNDLGLSEADAIAHVDGTLDRMGFRDKLYGEYPECIGGFSYDPVAALMTTYSASVECDAVIEEISAGYPFDVVLVRTNHTIDTLIAIADDLTEHPPSGLSGFDFALADYENNSIRVVLSEVSSSRVLGTRSDDAILVDDPRLDDIDIYIDTDALTDVSEVCTSSYGCGFPLRSGVELKANGWISSLGFTATSRDGTRWALTTFHHGSNDVNMVVSHGQQGLGPVREALKNDANGVDWARVRIDNQCWLNGTKGWLASPKATSVSYYSNLAPNALYNDGAIPLSSYTGGTLGLQTNDTVCLYARSTRSYDMCGRIAGWSAGYRTVTYDACPGDSGGGWVFTTSSGQKVAVGIHQGGTEGCPILRGKATNSGNGGSSRFTTLNKVHGYMDATAGQLFRVDVR